MNQEVLTLKEASKLLRINHQTLRRWAVSGKFGAFRYNGIGPWRVTRESVDKFIESHQATQCDKTTAGAAS